MKHRFAAVVAAGGAVAIAVPLLAASGAGPTPYEQAQALVKRTVLVETEAKGARLEAESLVVALKPKEEPPAEGKEQTAWAPASTTQVPLADAQAAARVIHKSEVHADNTPFNNYVPTTTELEAAHKADTSGFSILTKYVTGKPGLSNPSTDDLIQWEAAKWGIPADWLRAEFVDESNWHQLECSGQVACNTTGGPAGAGLEGRGFGDKACSNFRATPSAGVIGGCAYTSVGITQIKSRPESDPHPGTEPLRWKSTAWNLDYQGAVIRYYYNGSCSWCSPGYGAGQQWASIGGWFNPSPWNNFGALEYQKRVQGFLSARTWTQGGF